MTSAGMVGADGVNFAIPSVDLVNGLRALLRRVQAHVQASQQTVIRPNPLIPDSRTRGLLRPGCPAILTEPIFGASTTPVFKVSDQQPREKEQSICFVLF